LLALSFGVGHRILEGAWPPAQWAAITSAGPWRIGVDVLSGGAVLGLVLGAVLGSVAYVVSMRARPHPDWAPVVEETARRYMPSGILHWEFVRGKLLYDPLYREVWSRLGAHAPGRIVDLGCGRGIVLALADGARRARSTPDAAASAELVGVEVRPAAARVARLALGDAARIEIADLSDYAPPDADALLLLDVLHYLDAPAQERLLGRVARALRPGGVLLAREPDASSGTRFLATRWAERLRALARGAWRQRFHYRTGSEWVRLLGDQGLAVSATPMDRDTPFANVLFEARRPAVLDTAPVTISATAR
jgi:SAM-dependent methyltransferase